MSGKIGGRSCITFTDVKGLFLFSEDDIADFFSQVEPSLNVRIVFDRETGRPRGFGFGVFENAAENAIGSKFMGR
uniref:RRM domain-containing protein n=1 Tax=Ascaris lumbricoides TaxID=6252 RepID=A0A0M3HJQ8_ASCLU